MIMIIPHNDSNNTHNSNTTTNTNTNTNTNNRMRGRALDQSLPAVRQDGAWQRLRRGASTFVIV